MKDANRLVQLCDEAWRKPEWQPENGTTHCNAAADYVAAGMGCLELRDEKGQPLLADAMYDVMLRGGSWRPMTLGAPHVYAAAGTLVFGIMTAEMLGQTHGHIATVIPGDPLWSEHWKAMSPLCMNVGRENFMGRPMSFAFKTIPMFFAWRDSL